MHKFLTHLIVVGCTLASQAALASREGILAWSEFAIAAPGIASSGPIKVSGSQGPEGILWIKVEMFGRELSAPPSTIKALQGFSANGLQLSYEGGYKEVGGRTIYLNFSRGFTSGVVGTKIVLVNERGEFKVIDDPRRR